MKTPEFTRNMKFLKESFSVNNLKKFTRFLKFLFKKKQDFYSKKKIH
jgi:hypothetical protein